MPIGTGLWQIGLELFQRSGKAHKLGGVLVIVIAAAYSPGVALLLYWEFLDVFDLF